jgi:Cu(I)/Ag(I) efflux system membrane fusion protein
VDFVYPTLSERTRTLRVRFTVENRDGRLRPGLYGSAEFKAEPRTVLTVPRDAIVDTGASQHVFVAGADGVFQPRPVRLGIHLTDRVEVVEGLKPGEAVVASGVFLIDSESRLRASGGGSGHGAHGKASPQPVPEEDGSHSGHAR